jgi:hypothetical protein
MVCDTAVDLRLVRVSNSVPEILEGEKFWKEKKSIARGLLTLKVGGKKHVNL